MGTAWHAIVLASVRVQGCRDQMDAAVSDLVRVWREGSPFESTTKEVGANLEPPDDVWRGSLFALTSS